MLNDRFQLDTEPSLFWHQSALPLLGSPLTTWHSLPPGAASPDARRVRIASVVDILTTVVGYESRVEFPDQPPNVTNETIRTNYSACGRLNYNSRQVLIY